MTSNAGFFRAQEPPAVLKHGILRRYPRVFASAAGRGAGRVVLLDGYAGRGRYEDGAPGSPVLLMQTAERTAFRDVECHFVEMDHDHFRHLLGVVNEFPELACTAHEGDLSDHLDSILPTSEDAALFAFLDPFGTALAYSELVERILGRPPRPPTEVLLHFSVNAIRRIGGLLRKRGTDASALDDRDRKTIARVDRFLGGDWWHVIAHSVTDQPGAATRIAEKVLDAYCQRIRQTTGFGTFVFPVRERPHHEPEYFLVLFTRHPYALWRFNDSLSLANAEWQEAWRGKVNSKAAAKAEAAEADRRHAIEESGVLSLFGDDDYGPPAPVLSLPPFNELVESIRWEAEIEANLRLMLDRGVPFRLMDHIGDVYGSVVGLAREKHVCAALKRLHAAGLCDDDGRSKGVHNRTIKPLHPPGVHA